MRDLIIIICVIILFLFVFTSKGKNVIYQPIQPQTIFDVEVSTMNITTEKKVATFEFSQANLPVYNVYSELYLPEKFIANVTQSKSQADYIIVNQKLLDQKFVFLKEEKPKQIQQTEPVKTEIIKKKTKEEKETKETEFKQIPKQEELNFQNIKIYVNKNTKTYFYPTLSSGKDVIVSVVSYTPFEQQQGILKIKIENNQESFFFISTFQILSAVTNEKLPIKVFCEQFVSPASSIEGFILFPTTEKKFIFVLQDNTGKVFKLNFNIP